MTMLNKHEPGPSRDHSPVEKSHPAYLATDLGKSIVLIALTLLMIYGSRWISPSLGGFDQVASVVVLSSFLIVAAFGQQMVVLIGGLDLSVPSMITLGGLVAFAWAPDSLPALAAAALAVAVVSGAVGAMSGLGVAVLGIPPFIMTLSTGIILYSAALGISGGAPKGATTPTIEALFAARVFGVPPVIPLMVVFVVAAILLLSRTSFGRRLYAIGTNKRAAEIAGLPVLRMTVATYAIAAAASGFCGLMLVGFAGGATLLMGQSYLLPSIAAVVVGGTAISGGRGSFLSVVAAALLITTFSTVISSIRIDEGWRTIIFGLMVLVAVIAMNSEPVDWVRRQLSTPSKAKKIN